jgi:hypothetical protein
MGYSVCLQPGVRPALKLNLESVIFKSDTKTFELRSAPSPSAPSTTHGTTTRPNKAERVSGADRYATSADVAEWAAENGLGWGWPVVATGRDFADALSAAAVCGAKRSVLLLADSVDAPTIGLLRQNRSRVVRAYVAGGTSAVSSAVESAVRNALR